MNCVPIVRQRVGFPYRSGLKKMKKKPSVSHEAEQIRDFRKHPDRAMKYLNACVQVAFEENDPELVLTGLSVVAKTHGMTRLAREAHLQRESLHRMLSKHGNPEWNSIFQILKALRIKMRLEFKKTVTA